MLIICICIFQILSHLNKHVQPASLSIASQSEYNLKMFLLPPVTRCNPLKGGKLYLNRTFNLSLSTLRATVVTTRGWKNRKFLKHGSLGKCFSDLHCRQNQQKSTLECSHNQQSCCISSHAGRDTCHTWMEVFEQEEQDLVHWKIKRKPCQNVVCYNLRPMRK